MLNIIDNFSSNCIPENTFLISFDVVNMFPSMLVMFKFFVIMYENPTTKLQSCKNRFN